MPYFNRLAQAFHRRRIALGILCLVTTISLGAYALASAGGKQTLAQTDDTAAGTETGTGLTTVRPTLISGSSSVMLLGSVLSHETANIYPRRNGIVEDIYMDIGDTVKKNQVVALLLPKGVEGQSAAMIAEKQARKSQAESDLRTSEQVAQETIINTRQNIHEKETELMIARRKQEALLQKFAESEAHIGQMREQAFTAVQQARQLIEWITLGSNSRSDTTVRDQDILKNLGIQDSSNAPRYGIVADFNALFQAEQEYAAASDAQKGALIDYLIPLGLQALATANSLLQYTPTQPAGNGIDQLSHQQLTERLNSVLSAQDVLYKSKEKLEDARNSFMTLTSGEPDLYRAYRSGTTEDVSSNTVRMLQEQIRTANNALELTEANQEQMIEMKRSQVDIAAAMLQSEYAQSGHREVRSPFAGVVSKRFIDVGDIVMPSMSAFELTGVPTSLAKKAKTEIQFGLPEQFIGALGLGDAVTFFLQSDETTAYQAEVTRKSPQVDMQTHTVTVQAKVPDELSLPHGTSIRVRLTDEANPIFRVPSAAVKREADSNYVWALEPATGRPVQRTVSVVAEDGEFAEVTGSVDSETEVITDPPALFSETAS